MANYHGDARISYDLGLHVGIAEFSAFYYMLLVAVVLDLWHVSQFFAYLKKTQKRYTKSVEIGLLPTGVSTSTAVTDHQYTIKRNYVKTLRAHTAGTQLTPKRRQSRQ